MAPPIDVPETDDAKINRQVRSPDVDAPVVATKPSMWNAVQQLWPDPTQLRKSRRFALDIWPQRNWPQALSWSVEGISTWPRAVKFLPAHCFAKGASFVLVMFVA